MGFAVASASPALDAGERLLDARAIAADAVAFALRMAAFGQHQIFRAGQIENIGFLEVAILRQAFVGPAGDGGQGDVPAHSEDAVAAAGIVVQRKLRHETRARRRQSERNAERSGPLGAVRRKCFADAA